MAREIGDISSLFPPGITRLTDLPFTIHNAISSALAFLTFEEMPLEERPPKRIWLNGKKMKEWWAEVTRLREAKMKGEPETDMAKNALKDRLLKGF